MLFKKNLLLQSFTIGVVLSIDYSTIFFWVSSRKNNYIKEKKVMNIFFFESLNEINFSFHNSMENIYSLCLMLKKIIKNKY